MKSEQNHTSKRDERKFRTHEECMKRKDKLQLIDKKLVFSSKNISISDYNEAIL